MNGQKLENVRRSIASLKAGANLGVRHGEKVTDGSGTAKLS
jgi:hypothetical protein